jgi:pimeloyl-ACP methyl ester carboxylesterase
VVEWGDEGDPPLLFAHGGFDFAETLNVFAPILARAGWRVVSWDQRGHGDSDHADLYSWHADTRDAAAVVHSTTDEAMPWIGHSKGGVLTMQLSEVLPHRLSKLVNLDGLPSRRFVPDVAEQRNAMMSEAALGWLDHRASLEGKQRRPGTIEGLAQRRARMNIRMSPEWLQYLVTVGATAGRRRLALEDRSDAAHGRLGPVATGMVDGTLARSRGAVPGRARPGTRGDGVGHASRGRRGLPAARRPV